MTSPLGALGALLYAVGVIAAIAGIGRENRPLMIMGSCLVIIGLAIQFSLCHDLLPQSWDDVVCR
jgi:hypothetical protein